MANVVVTYWYLKGWNEEAFFELEKIQFELVRLQAWMLNSIHPNCVGTLPESSLRTGFIMGLSKKSVNYFIDPQTHGQFSGPYIDIILSLRNQLIVRLLDQWKDVSIEHRYSGTAAL